MLSVDDFENYIEEIELIDAQNRVEFDLYSIIANIIRARKESGKISLRDVSGRRRTEFAEIFEGKSGFPDFVVRERVKNNDTPPLGAIEVKYTGRDLDDCESIEQLKGHIESYKKVIYTNGLQWRYYENSIHTCKWESVLGEIDGGKIIWYDKCNWESLIEKLDEINWIK